MTTTTIDPGTEALVETLREQVEAGTVIMFKYNFDLNAKPEHRKYYTYVAIWIAAQDRWYLTSESDSGLARAMSNDMMMTHLAKPNTKKAWVVTEFARFKP